MERKYLVPAPGRKVRDEITSVPFPKEGKEVPMTTYLRRRLACGDLVEGTPPAPAPTAAAPDVAAAQVTELSQSTTPKKGDE